MFGYDINTALKLGGHLPVSEEALKSDRLWGQRKV